MLYLLISEALLAGPPHLLHLSPPHLYSLLIKAYEGRISHF